jgi:hypothetical protein
MIDGCLGTTAVGLMDLWEAMSSSLFRQKAACFVAESLRGVGIDAFQLRRVY